MSSLPWGVTDAMCEPNDPPCGSCGHPYSDHYETDKETDHQQFNYKKELVEELLNSDGHHEASSIVYDADGFVTHACDCTSGGKTQEEKLKNQCDCEGFNDEPHEPDYDDYRDDMD